MGMFSTLPYLIDAPLEETLTEIPLSDDVKNALLAHEGNSGILYDLVLSYEKADWTGMTELATKIQIPTEVLTTIYFDCVDMVNTIWDSLNTKHALEEQMN